MTLATRSNNHINIQLDNLITLHIPADVLNSQQDTLSTLDRIDANIVASEAKLRELHVKRLQVKYGLIAKCMCALPFKLSAHIFEQVVIINNEFMNHPKVMMWVNTNRKRINATQSMKGRSNETRTIQS